MTTEMPTSANVVLGLAEVARALDSIDSPHERVQRALELLRPMVPYQRCALATSAPSRWLIVNPPTYGEDTEKVRSRLMLRLAAFSEPEAPLPPPADGAKSLGVPVIALGQVLGVLSVDASPGDGYDVQHQRLLAVVAAQIGAYLTMLRLRDDEARTSRKLVAAHDFQQVLAGMVSQDLRNPLSVITVAATDLLRRPADAVVTRTVERTLRCAQRVDRIIGDLLDATESRVNGELAISPSRVDLKALLTKAVAEARVAHPRHTLELKVPRERVWGEWDAQRLSQALSNLLGNAAQHGDETSRVKIVLEGRGDSVAIAITNQGTVIAPEVVEVMFDPFRPGAPAHKASGSLGLGLFIARQIAEAHGGRVECRSLESGSTTFTLTLPLSARHGDGMKAVLVVDDDGDVRASMVEALEGHGYRVATASNGERALEQLKRGLNPRVVLLDLHMPVMDGATFCAQVSEDPRLRVIPVLLLTSDSEEAERLTRQGAAGYLPKPLQVDSLLAQVKKLTAPV